MKKKWLVATLIGLFLIALTGSVFAWSGKADVTGKPDEFSPNGREGYYIWQDNDGFHIWTTTRGANHVFSGTIRTDGKLFQVRGNRLEAGDSFKTYGDIQERSWFNGHGNRGNHFAVAGRDVTYETDKIQFKFETAGGSDGLNFHVSDARYVDFDLYIDGHPVSTKKIHLGESSWHPYSHSFRIMS